LLFNYSGFCLSSLKNRRILYTILKSEYFRLLKTYHKITKNDSVIIQNRNLLIILLITKIKIIMNKQLLLFYDEQNQKVNRLKNSEEKIIEEPMKREKKL